MSSTSPGSEPPWPCLRTLIGRIGAPKRFTALPTSTAIDIAWTCAALAANEENSNNPLTERATMKQETYGKQFGRISDALEYLIDKSSVEHNDAIEEFLELKHHIDAIKQNTAITRF